MITMDIELKICPFCGGKAFFANRFTIGKRCRTVVCEDCHAVVTNFEGEDKEKAAEMWNSRSLDMIPCSKEMPESNISVLCAMRTGEYRIMEYDEEEQAWYEGIHDYRKHCVTHWMPLPKIPKED